MIWVDSLPDTVAPVGPLDSAILQSLAVPHTSLLLILTASSVTVLDINSLTFLSNHSRTQDSIDKHGTNKQVKIRHLGVNTSQLQRQTNVNLFVQTDANYLIIYQVNIDYSKSIYEISGKVNNELIQAGLPLSWASSKFSLSSLMKSATRSILAGTSATSLNLENIEHFNNRPIEDELGSQQIHPVKISIYKIIKISLGVFNYWLVPNQHFLIVFNDRNLREDSSEGNYFQTVDLKSFESNMFELSDFQWYGERSAVTYIAFNKYEEYFLLTNKDKEVWFMQLELKEEKLVPKAEKVLQLDYNGSLRCHFCPQSDLIIFKLGKVLKLFRLSSLERKLILLHSIHLATENTSVAWSSCGSFFFIHFHDTGYWSLFSKFGNILFESSRVLSELNEHTEESLDFLHASKLIITPNASRVILINRESNRFYSVKLLRSASPTSDMFYNQDYISYLSYDAMLYKTPLLAKFKNIIASLQHINLQATKSNSPSGKFTIDRSKSNQISLSYGEHLSISTPCGKEHEKNHVLWYNFRNHFLNTMNIVSHFWYDDFLVLVNRFFNEGNEIDELLVLDTLQSKYGQSGVEYIFDSDRIIWRRSFNNKIIAHDLSETANNLLMLTCVTSDLKILVIEFSGNTPKTVDDFREMTKHPKLNIRFHKTVHLSAIENRLAISKVVQVSMIYDQHFLFLLGSGELYMLKSVSSLENTGDPLNVLRPAHMYQLVHLHDSNFYFKFKSFDFGSDTVNYVCMLTHGELYMYDLKDLVDTSVEEMDLGIDSEELMSGSKTPKALLLKFDSLMPVLLCEITNEKLNALKSIDIIGLQTELFTKRGRLFLQTRVNRQLVLNNFIEMQVMQNRLTSTICNMFQDFENFHYCLELLLFKYLTFDRDELCLKRLFEVIETLKNSEAIYVNCLRKIEVEYWDMFFKTLDTTPTVFMKRLISNENVELCYNYLIVYLNYKREEDEQKDNSLDESDKEIILNIIRVLTDAQKWDWCFELCRFIKLLEPKGSLLQTILATMK